MIRQRIYARTPGAALVARLLTLALAVIVMYAGAMLVLLAVKVSPHTVNSLSGYRTIFDDAVGLRHSQFDTRVSLIAGFAGLLVFFAFAYLAYQELPRPYLARQDVSVPSSDARGRTVARARALERIAEIAAGRQEDVASAAGRLGDDEINLDVSVRRAGSLEHTLGEVQERVSRALAEHEMPRLAVNVTATSYDPQTTRELS